MTTKKIIPLIIGAAALTIGVATSEANSYKAVFAYDGLDAPSLSVSLDTFSARFLSNVSELNTFNVQDMAPYSSELGNDYYTFDHVDGVGIASERENNKNFRATFLPVSFYMHLEARQQVTFAELELKVTAYKSLSNAGSANCIIELFDSYPTTINSAANDAKSNGALARARSSGTTRSSASYQYGSYTFTNESNDEADIYLPDTFYIVVITKYASGYEHHGVGEVSGGNKYCTDVRSIDSKDIQIEFDNANTVYYRQEGSDASSIAYTDMSAVEFTNGENEIFDAYINDRLAVVTEKSMNKYFNIILIPFRFYVNLDPYQMVTISEFNITLTIRKIASNGTAGAFVELFNARPETITTTWNAASSPNYSVGRVSTSNGSSNLSLIHDRLAKSCSCDGYAFANDTANNQNIYSNYFYIAICGNYASTWDHMVEATMNVVPAEGDSVISYTRDVTLNGTNCTISGGLTANYQSQYNATIIPDAHYTYPSAIEVLMGGVPLLRHTHYSYNDSTGQITINANVVSDNIVINAEAVLAKYAITYSAGEGTGANYVVNNLTYGSYDLVSFATTNFIAPQGQKFKCWSIDANEYDPGDSYIVETDTLVTAIYEDLLITDYLERASSFATLFATETVENEVLSVSSVFIRFNASILVSDWEAINAKWEITDYGVMLVKKNTLDNTYQVSSVEEAYRNGKTLAIGRKGNGVPPNADDDVYSFNVKLTVNNYDVVFSAAPFIVAGGEYYFLEEMDFSVNTLAQYHLAHGGSSLSNSALTLLSGNQGE